MKISIDDIVISCSVVNSKTLCFDDDVQEMIDNEMKSERVKEEK